MVGVGMGDEDIDAVANEIVDQPINSSPGIQDDTQFGDDVTCGLSKISGAVSIGTQHNEFHF
jgi:hypothetical protein